MSRQDWSTRFVKGGRALISLEDHTGAGKIGGLEGIEGMPLAIVWTPFGALSPALLLFPTGCNNW